MPFVPFHEALPALAEQETRTLTVMDDASFSLPAGEYALMEMYCDETDCDCRRVFFYVQSSRSRQCEAVIAYGWESPRFYAQWMGDNDPQMAQELKGPILNPGSPQTALSPALLDIVQTVVLQDKRYVERLKTHYALFREAIGAGWRPQPVPHKTRSQRPKLTNAQKRQRRRQRKR